MFDIAWSEMAVIAGVALLVIGPKDLPKVLRTVGQWTSKARAMAHEFQSAIEELANEDDLKDLKDLKQQIESDFPTGVGSEFGADALANTIDPDGGLRKSLDAINRPEKAAAAESAAEGHGDGEGESEIQTAEALAAELIEPPPLKTAAAEAQTEGSAEKTETEALAAELVEPPPLKTVAAEAQAKSGAEKAEAETTAETGAETAAADETPAAATESPTAAQQPAAHEPAAATKTGTGASG